jgi:hypothetical protein
MPHCALLSPQDLSTWIGQGKYIRCCNAKGILINDQCYLKLDDNPGAGSRLRTVKDMWLWARAITRQSRLG